MQDEQEGLIELEIFKDVKAMLYQRDYYDPKLQATFRKIRHHIDRMIEQLEEIVSD